MRKYREILININSRKAAGPDEISPKIVNIIDSHVTNTINSDLKRNVFSDSAKGVFLTNELRVTGYELQVTVYCTS